MALNRAALSLSLFLFAFTVPLCADALPVPEDVTLTAPDGVQLKATYYAAAKPGPGVVLLHMCNTTRTSWEPLGPQLAAAGIHAIALDYRGFGESGGARANTLPPAEAQKVIDEKWGGDIDAAYEFLIAHGADRSRIGAAGGSCGVNQALKLASRHPEVRSLVLLAGPASAPMLDFIFSAPSLPLFAAAAADDQFDATFPAQMQWMLALSGNSRNRFHGFKDGKHGTEIFAPHPELPKEIVAWYVDTLVTGPAGRTASAQAAKTPAREFWTLAHAPEGAAKAAAMFRDWRARNPKEMLVPEASLNLMGYQHLQAGRTEQAIALFTLNTEAHPNSANAWDSLGDAYVAAGKNDLALKASLQVLEVLPADPGTEQYKQAVRASAEQKIARLKAEKP